MKRAFIVRFGMSLNDVNAERTNPVPEKCAIPGSRTVSRVGQPRQPLWSASKLFLQRSQKCLLSPRRLTRPVDHKTVNVTNRLVGINSNKTRHLPFPHTITAAILVVAGAHQPLKSQSAIDCNNCWRAAVWHRTCPCSSVADCFVCHSPEATIDFCNINSGLSMITCRKTTSEIPAIAGPPFFTCD